MGSYVQVIVGGMLLVTAFLVGRHINDKPIVVTSSAVETADDSPVNLQASPTRQVTPALDKVTDHPSSPDNVEPNQLQKSLRERILGERNKEARRIVSAEHSAANEFLANNKPQSPFTLSEQDIVVPDFSNFDTIEEEPEPITETVKKSVGALAPKSDNNTLPQKIVGDIVVGPIPSERLAEAPKRKFNFKDSVEQPRSINARTRRGSMQPINSPSSNRMVAVRHRENRITTETQEFIDYTTVFGDTLHGLSNRFFGKPDYYLDIYLANKDVFQNPSTVPVNTSLKIPVMAELIGKK